MIFVRTALETTTREALRLYLLDSHYRRPFDHDETQLVRAAERTTALAEANSRIAARRAEVMAEAERVRAAAADQIEAAVVAVSSRAAELATGHRPDPARVAEIVSSLLAGSSR